MRRAQLVLLMLILTACGGACTAVPVPRPDATDLRFSPSIQPVVPHEARWGIYRLRLDTNAVDLVFSSPIAIASLGVNSRGDRFIFSQKAEGGGDATEEIYTLSTDGSDLRRITTNTFWDLYPVWSPDGSRVAFLSQRAASLGIYLMNADGGEVGMLQDSSSHEADIDWRGEQIVYTRDNSIWVVQSDGTGVRRLTNPPRAGEWGNANLPFGDYDPRLSPDGTQVVFERLVGDQAAHGNYDFFSFDMVTSKETRLTRSGYSQGLASWSRSGTQLAYIVAAIGEAGQYDIYTMSADGTKSQNVTPAYFPSEFLCHSVAFSVDDAVVYFIGEWWPSG